jgi:hypothetical protein
MQKLEQDNYTKKLKADPLPVTPLTKALELLAVIDATNIPNLHLTALHTSLLAFVASETPQEDSLSKQPPANYGAKSADDLYDLTSELWYL